MIGRPIPLHPRAQPTRFAVRLQQEEEGREESGHAFFGISVPIHNGGLHQDGSVLRLVGGKEGSSKQ